MWSRNADRVTAQVRHPSGHDGTGRSMACTQCLHVTAIVLRTIQGHQQLLAQIYAACIFGDIYRLRAVGTCIPMLLGRGAAPNVNKLARTPTLTPPSMNSLRQARPEDCRMIRCTAG